MMNWVWIAVGLLVCALLSALLARANAQILRLRAQLAEATEAQRTKDSLLEQRGELDTIKDEFISTVSHELRTPLTSIRGALGLLNSGVLGPVDAKAQNLLRIAVTNTDRLIRLINDILDLERMESGRAPLQTRRCNMRDLAQQAIDAMVPLAETAGVTLELISPSPQGTYFDGDPDRIQQILTNLLSNAVKFSYPGGRVQVWADADPDNVLLRVTDAGRGIPVDKLSSIFDRFQQVEASDSRQKGGTGLGLAICRTIVTQHNGAIWAESNEAQGRGPGATLVLTLPRLGRAGDSPLPALTPAPEAVGTHATVVLCDDDPGVRTVVGEHLRRQGYQVLEAESGDQAIRLANQHRVSAILLDLHMPGLNGQQTLQLLRSSDATRRIPVVILSGMSPGAQAEEAEAAQGWLQKPFHEHLLAAELSRVLKAGATEEPPRVLLVEDDEDLASLVMAGFSEGDFRVRHASSQREALEQCRREQPDLVILDLTLPDGDGFGLVEWFREQPELKTMPLFVYSGRDLSEQERDQLRLGPTEFLTKARTQPAEVEEMVRSTVQRLQEPEMAGPIHGSR